MEKITKVYQNKKILSAKIAIPTDILKKIKWKYNNIFVYWDYPTEINSLDDININIRGV